MGVCGTTQRVLQPMERFLDERDYKVKKVKGLVLLAGVICRGTPVFGRCDRCCHLFWRQEWLEKIESPALNRKICCKFIPVSVLHRPQRNPRLLPWRYPVGALPPADRRLRLDALTASPRAHACWIDPRSGKCSPAGETLTQGAQLFTSPVGWEDSLLYIDV